MRPIRLPEPPSPNRGVPEIFEGGAYNVIRRAIVIGNGFPGSENQSIGLVRALGLADNHVLYVSLNSTNKLNSSVSLELLVIDPVCGHPFINLYTILVYIEDSVTIK